MKDVKILDCTLRDGGYCNNWEFGEKNIPHIIQGLENSGVDIIECGFVNTGAERNRDRTIYSKISQMDGCLVNRAMSNKQQYVCMANYGQLDIDQLEPHYEGAIDGIRLAFHKKDMDEAFGLAEKIIEKGYRVYIQPMVVLDYSDEDLLKLIQLTNSIVPEVFYIVDSFGVMKRKELIHIFYMVEKNLDKRISIGFHTHNNMQLSYANAQTLLELQHNRELVIDCSVFGMGRGAGNLNTELFEQYLNENYEKEYEIAPLLNIFDQILQQFYIQNGWGYSLPNYLSAKYNAHPNYAMYFSQKNTLTVSDVDNLFQRMDKRRKNQFDSNYAETLYSAYMKHDVEREQNYQELINHLQGKNIVVIALGQSGKDEKDSIIEFVEKEKCIVVSINQEYEFYSSDYIFVSNLRRFTQIDKTYHGKMIITSNIVCREAYLSINYDDYVNEYEMVQDNAALMLLKFLSQIGVQKIYLAGLDGFAHDVTENYADKNMIIKTSDEIFDKRNKGLTACISEFAKKQSIEFLTMPKYVTINE